MASALAPAPAWLIMNTCHLIFFIATTLMAKPARLRWAMWRSWLGSALSVGHTGLPLSPLCISTFTQAWALLALAIRNEP